MIGPKRSKEQCPAPLLCSLLYTCASSVTNGEVYFWMILGLEEKYANKTEQLVIDWLVAQGLQF